MYETSWFKKKSLEAFLITLWYSENQFTYLQSTKNGKGTYMILFSFCKNAVVFKTFFIYQNTNFWTEIPFSKNLYHIETTQLICNTNQLTGFSMIRIFTGRFFRTGITKQTKIKKKYLGKEIEIKIIMLKIFCKVVFNTILT